MRQEHVLYLYIYRYPARQISCQELIIVVATGFMLVAPLTTGSTMVMWKSSQWLGLTNMKVRYKRRAEFQTAPGDLNPSGNDRCLLRHKKLIHSPLSQREFSLTQLLGIDFIREHHAVSKE